MIAEALKHIRVMKHQFQVYEHAEKVLEELSVVAETGAQVRRETAEAQKRLIEVEATTHKTLYDAQEVIRKATLEYSTSQVAKEAIDSARWLELQSRLENMVKSVDNYKVILSRLDQEVDKAKCDHRDYMEKSKKEKAFIEEALSELRNRLKI